MLKRCTKCLMPDTKPGVTLNEEGLCQACVNWEMKGKTDWDQRWEELKAHCDKYRKNDGSYDCIITVSGGKDSHFQVHVFKELLGMNPLLVRVTDPFTRTQTGDANVRNITEYYGCDMLSYTVDPNVLKKMMRISFEGWGSASWPLDWAVYAAPLKLAIKLDIPFVIYGENVSWEYGGPGAEETPSAKNQIYNNVAKYVDFSVWTDNGITEKQLNAFNYPTVEEMEAANLDPTYLSYYVPWDGYMNYQVVKKHGFRDLHHEWNREGYIENYEQVDTIGYIMNSWLKYPKFGFNRATDVVGYYIRSGQMTKEEAIKLIKENDHKMDRKVFDDYLKFTGYSIKEFWDIVDKLYNTEHFEKDRWGLWKLKDSI